MGKKWEWDLCFRWEWECSSRPTKLTEGFVRKTYYCTSLFQRI